MKQAERNGFGWPTPNPTEGLDLPLFRNSARITQFFFLSFFDKVKLDLFALLERNPNAKVYICNSIKQPLTYNPSGMMICS